MRKLEKKLSVYAMSGMLIFTVVPGIIQGECKRGQRE